MKDENHMALGISLGLCFGAGAGLTMGQLFFDNMSMGIVIGAGIGMLVGLIVGMQIKPKS